MNAKRIDGLTIAALLVLLGCALPTATITPEANMPNPAAEFCVARGGQSEIRTAADGSQTGYCIFSNGSECEEWAYYRGECAPGGAGMPNPASVYCQEHGGQLEIRTAADGSQSGYCLFPDGSECEEWAYFRGECAPGGASPDTSELIALVQAGLPTDAFAGIGVLPLTVQPGNPPLWAVYSYGMRNWSLSPLLSHFVAIYTYSAGWQELARLELDSAGANPVQPDYIDQAYVNQALIVSERIWIEVQGGAGAHGGTYHLLSFDGTALAADVAAFGASPGNGWLADVNGDGVLDVVIDASDYYVFCYACGVRFAQYQVYYWNAPNQQIMEATLQPFLMGQPQPMRDLVNPAVAAAEAGLWAEALDLITQAEALLPQYPESDAWTLDWDAGLIALHASAREQDALSSPYPILSNVFYGDYAAAVDLMRSFTPAQIFSPDSPLIVGTPAESWESTMSQYIINSANAALAIHPDLAAAYFLRGWARYLVNPTDPVVAADVDQAAALAPDDVLFTQSAAYLH